VIPLVDLRAQYRSIKPEIDRAVERVLDSGRFVLGEEVAAFEQEFAAFSGAGHGIAVNSGTSALHLALLAAGVGRDDEVITVPFTFVATVAAIRYTGARPIFVDVEPRSLTMDVGRLEAVITARTRAIVPVHLYGQAADMDPIMDTARRHGLVVIEDAAQAHGAEYKGRRVGGIGDLACFSFYPGKNLGAYGEGGLVTTSNATYARTIRMLRDWGEETRYHHVVQAFNYRMDAIQGAILRVKLGHLPAWTEKRRAHAARYHELLAPGPVRRPEALPDRRHVYHLYVVRTRRRADLQEALLARAIGTGIHYPIPVHLQKAHADLGYGAGDFPGAEEAAAEVLSLPLYPELPAAAQDDIVATVRGFAG
jgi:dTDP-4-amino-4,6-dideoxygalactose transaminase